MAKQENTQLITASDIIQAVKYSITKSEKESIEQACEFAKQKHKGQKRYSGEPYYTHTFEVGRLLAAFGMQTNVVIAGILHDTIEDTDTTAKEIEEMFNKEVAFFVESVSHLGDVRYHGLATRVKSLQKLFVAISKDVRVIIIKLMDRLHNMRTIGYVPKEKRQRLIKETQLVYVPIANRLGMGKVKTEIEDLAFKELDPETYAKIHEQVQEKIGSTVIV